jgi:hypothetical protein
MDIPSIGFLMMKLRFGHDKHKSRLPVMTLHLRPTEQPPKSKIKLINKQDELLIHIPPHGFHPFWVFAMCLGSVVSFFGGLSFLVGMVSAVKSLFGWGKTNMGFVENAMFSLVFLPFLIIGLLAIFGSLVCFFGKTCLLIKNQTIYFETRLFGFRINRHQPLSRLEIHRLVLIPEHFYRDADGDRCQHLAELQIGLGKQQIKLGSTVGLMKEDEVCWLATEISEWLDMPVEIIKP